MRLALIVVSGMCAGNFLCQYFGAQNYAIAVFGSIHDMSAVGLYLLAKAVSPCP